MFPGRTHSPTVRNVLGREIPPFTFTPRRFPAESDDPALNPPARFVAVRIESGRVGLCITSDGILNELKNDVVCRIIMMRRVLSETFSGRVSFMP